MKPTREADDRANKIALGGAALPVIQPGRSRLPAVAPLPALGSARRGSFADQVQRIWARAKRTTMEWGLTR